MHRTSATLRAASVSLDGWMGGPCCSGSGSRSGSDRLKKRPIMIGPLRGCRSAVVVSVGMAKVSPVRWVGGRALVHRLGQRTQLLIRDIASDMSREFSVIVEQA